MNDAEQFTPRDIADWKAYERVRVNGKYNMFDPRARRLTGLSGERYSFVIKNYSKLRGEITKATQP